ncbi:Type III secretion system chaperone [Sulfidibacter corallicola]|uniref:Type III secretion system chaperone n=1 Tax=Sulfidibacter corallicola TaxID=2818388 RepID=A0A8A4TKQ7_SULCO|nr:type III secretion system chaperone [Sulfidibacter corallicola]QTD49712.1 type III secretion system chaperone [Sulfidibacter corallicola]
MALDALLRQLANDAGVPYAGLGEDGSCTLTFGDRTEVYIVPGQNDSRIHLIAPLPPLPEQGSELLLHQMLQAQTLGISTEDAYFGLDSTTGELLLFRHLTPAAMDHLEFRQCLETFLDVHQEWCDRLGVSLTPSEGEAQPREQAPLHAPEPPTLALPSNALLV